MDDATGAIDPRQAHANIEASLRRRPMLKPADCLQPFEMPYRHFAGQVHAGLCKINIAYDPVTKGGKRHRQRLAREGLTIIRAALDEFDRFGRWTARPGVIATGVATGRAKKGATT